MKITITATEKGLRLDKFLTGKFPEYSRTYLQKLIKEGEILINDKKVKQGYSLKEGDDVVINFPEKKKMSLDPDPSIKFEVLYEDENVVVVNKPAGLTVHPSDNESDKTLVNGLLAKYPEIKSVGESSIRPGIVHRLDKDTSGIMIVAKNNDAYQFLKNQFQAKKSIKKYIALVAGDVRKEDGIISFPIARKRKLPTKQVAVKNESQARGKIREAVTEYKVVRRIDVNGKVFTLLEVTPKTGRMHQIRVHFSAIGHPLAGDLKYGSKNVVSIAGLDRQFLHAKSLEIEVPIGKDGTLGKKMTFEAPLPDDLKKFIK